jgi:nitrogen fixation/metabolism regulation signal transduction histidine kinase
MQQINLYQEMFKPQRRSRTGEILVGLFVAIVVSMAVAGWWQQHTLTVLQQRHTQQTLTQSNLQQQLAQLSDKVAQLKPSALLARKLSETQRQLYLRQPVLDQLNQLSAKKDTIVDGLEALAAQPLPQTWLNVVRFARGGEDVHLKGYALNAERLPELVRTLAQQPVYSGRHFSFVRLEQQKSGVYGFDLSTRQEDAHE